jgi:menaquinone-specific isochorismate synthase
VSGDSQLDATLVAELIDEVPHVDEGAVFAWIQSGEGFVAHGVARRIEGAAGPDRFIRAREAVTEALNELAVPGAIAVGSFTFDPHRDGSVLRVPATLTRLEAGVKQRVVIDADAAPIATSTSRTRSKQADGVPQQSARRPRFAGASVADDCWLEAVQAAIDAIIAGRAEKVVLARDQHLWARAPFDVQDIVRRLVERFPTCTTFLVDGLVGASPETLVRLRGREVSSLVLAGTAARGQTDAEDRELGARLLGAEKDRAEHQHAVDSVRTLLKPLCTNINVPEEPELLRLANVQHLATPISGTLAEPMHVLELVGLLHPTAAVGGTPRAEAVALIAEHEGLDRGRYTGPVGWCDANGDGEWAIALRCAEVRGDRARLFAGAGIVAGSIPVDELRETWLKLGAMRSVLGADGSMRLG